MTTETTNSERQARSQLAGVRELMEALYKAQKDGSAYVEGDNLTEDEIRERIEESPLSVEIRYGWRLIGRGNQDADAEYRIVLCTGGPAVQIIGDLDRHNEPSSARLQHQDWFTPWVDYPLDPDEADTLLQYASVFYFGE